MLFLAVVKPSPVKGLGTRFFSNDIRLGLVLAVAILVYAALYFGVRRGFMGHFLGLVSALGSGWLMWYLYNAVHHVYQPLFLGERSPSKMLHLFKEGGHAFLLAIAALVVGLLVYIANKGLNRVVRIVATAGAFVGTLLIVMIFLSIKAAYS